MTEICFYLKRKPTREIVMQDSSRKPIVSALEETRFIRRMAYSHPVLIPLLILTLLKVKVSKSTIGGLLTKNTIMTIRRGMLFSRTLRVYDSSGKPIGILKSDKRLHGMPSKVMFLSQDREALGCATLTNAGIYTITDIEGTVIAEYTVVRDSNGNSASHEILVFHADVSGQIKLLTIAYCIVGGFL